MSLKFSTSLIIFSLFLGGCTSTKVINANSTPAIQAVGSQADELLLDIGITPFDPNIPSKEEDLANGFIIPDVRRAESGYIAYHLKDTLELTGNWGAVRVTPKTTDTVGLHVTGKLLISDGEKLRISIRVVDATGKVWINKTYQDTASKFSYEVIKEDPFQELYNEIANDILLVSQ